MDLIYGRERISTDQNTRTMSYLGLHKAITSSWTGQMEPMNNRLSVNIPYYPKIIQPVPDFNAIEPLFSFPIYDRISNVTSVLKAPVTAGGSVLADYLPLPLSAKSNWIFRHSATKVAVTVLITSSSIIQGTIGFYVVKNFDRNVAASVQFAGTPDLANALGIMNLASDRSITLTLDFDEVYPSLDYGAINTSVQNFTRTLAAYPLTPILTTTDTPTTVFMTFLYATAVPNATGFLNAPNLMVMSKNGTVPSDDDVKAHTNITHRFDKFLKRIENKWLGGKHSLYETKY